MLIHSCTCFATKCTTAYSKIMKVSDRRKKFNTIALQLIHEKGFKAMTLRDLAKAMKCDVGNIYNYIDSKQALLEKFLFGISQAFHQAANDITQSSYSPKEKLKAIISLHIQLTATRPYEVALLSNEWRNLKAPRLSEFITEREQYEAKVKSIILLGMSEGDFRLMDLDIATQSILGCVRWLFNEYTNRDQEINPIEMEKQIFTLIFNGIGQ